MYASFTTIPSRLGLIKNCIDSLLDQDVDFRKIVVTIPKETLRREVRVDYTIPDFVNVEPYKSKVIINQPQQDYGPVMKYIGGVNIIPDDTIVFICDDDQEYNSNVASTLLKKYDPNAIVASKGYQLLLTSTLWGYGGVLMNSRMLQFLDDKVRQASNKIKTACQLVDDNWISILANSHNIKIIKVGLSDEQIHKNGHNTPDDGLSADPNKRRMDILKCTCALDTKNKALAVIIILLIVLIIVYAVMRNS